MNTAVAKKIFLIAGEASGDALGAKLMQALKEESDTPITFYGVGGERMTREGLDSIFPMEELSLLGFMEIIPHIPKLLRRINQVVEEIKRIQPEVVVTIDAPAFNNRVVKKLQRAGIKLVHYVAPTVWAYKPKRSQKFAKLYDYLLLLLPFEPPYFDAVGLENSFVGHPILEEDITGGDGQAFRQYHDIPEDIPLLAIMPGSRNSELKRLLPVFRETAELLLNDHPNMQVVMMATERFFDRLEEETKTWKLPVHVIGKAQKQDALAACNLALAKSGTGTLEFAMAGVPMVVAYKVNPLSAWLLRWMMKANYVNLVNLILGKPAIPELLQEECTPEKLKSALQYLLEDQQAREQQIEDARQAMQQLAPPQGISPSHQAARVVLGI